MATAILSQTEFYREFLMARNQIDPSQFGVALDKDDFIDQMCEDFNDAFRGTLTIDELLLHPRDAMRFCDDVRRNRAYYDVPDDIILRAILLRRKRPEA